jgi:hypothetical protein
VFAALQFLNSTTAAMPLATKLSGRTMDWCKRLLLLLVGRMRRSEGG